MRDANGSYVVRVVKATGAESPPDEEPPRVRARIEKGADGTYGVRMVSDVLAEAEEPPPQKPEDADVVGRTP